MALATEPSLVDLAAIDGVVLDIRYARADNFVGQALYPFAAAYLRKPAADKLAKAAAALKKDGYRLVVYDAYRPLSVQKTMWKAKPDSRYVARPSHGSQHNRGAAVDVALADASGKALEMPSLFDEFGARAGHAYAGGSAASRERRERLKRAMTEAGFKTISEEWWHYSDPEGTTWPLLDLPFETLRK